MQSFVQLVLEGFDWLSPTIAKAPLPVEASPATVAALHTDPVGPVPSHAQFAHPLANRHIVLAHTDVAYHFRRAKRRTIGMAVGPEGLVVSAPRWVGLAEVEAALREKARWIVKKLQEMGERSQRLAQKTIVWEAGERLPFLGDDVVLSLDPTQRSTHAGAWLNAAVPATLAAHGQPAVLCVGLPHSAEAGQIRDVVQAWLMRQAKVIFTNRLNHFAPLLKVHWRKLSLSSASTRWGSASADGAIRLNWRLVHFKIEVIDYVVVHELSHLRVMNHSPEFWDTVETILPDYPQWRDQLKDDVLPRW